MKFVFQPEQAQWYFGRSALVAESLQKMGYKNVSSMAGGFKAWKAAGLPTEK